jgi:hypothetical protein
MPSVAVQQRRFTNAVYLNNAAVVFMEHGAYQRAAQACKGAICLLQSLVVDKENDDTIATWKDESLDYSGSLNALEQTTVTITAQRLALLSVPNMEQTGAVVHSPILSVVTFDESLTTDFVQDAANNNGGSLYAIRMDASQIQTDATMLAECIHSTAPSIVLSNLALSLFLLGSVPTHRGDQKQSGAAAALRLLHQALSVMGVSDRTMMITEGNLFTAIALYCNLVAMLGRSGEHEDAAPTRQVELDMLVQVSIPLLTVTRTFVAMAGAA